MDKCRLLNGCVSLFLLHYERDRVSVSLGFRKQIQRSLFCGPIPLDASRHNRFSCYYTIVIRLVDFYLNRSKLSGFLLNAP